MIYIKNQMIGAGMPIVCVSLMDRTEEDIIEHARRLIGDGVRMLEWRLDHFLADNDLETAVEVLGMLAPYLKETIFLLTYRTVAEGGLGNCFGDDLLEILERITDVKADGETVADLVDIEPPAIRNTERFVAQMHERGLFVIASYHSMKRPMEPEAMREKLEELTDYRADIVKLAVMSGSNSDVLALMYETNCFHERHVHTPVISMAMGEKGTISRITGELTSSAVTFASDGVASAPGQIDYRRLRILLEELHGLSEKKDNLYLVGFMGSGKTSAGKELVKRSVMSGYSTLIDLDQMIEDGENKSVSEIFAERGESGFRDIETDYLAEVSTLNGVVVSCGGGIVLRDQNIDIMKATGIVAELTAEPETIIERLENDDTRPLLSGKKDIGEIKRMLEERSGAYERARDISIKTDKASVEIIADKIITMIKVMEGEGL